MTNQQWPPPGQSPWAQQDPNWRPPQFHDAAQRDPRLPFGQPSAPEPAIESEPPRRSRGTLFAVLGIVVVAMAAIIGLQFLSNPDAEPTPSPSAATQPAPTATRTGNWIPFEGNGDGIFEVVDSEWTADGLEVTIRVEVTQGEHNFAVYAFTDSTRRGYDPLNATTFTASVDEPFEGTFVFPSDMEKADSTIVLMTPSSKVLLNALPIEG